MAISTKSGWCILLGVFAYANLTPFPTPWPVAAVLRAPGAIFCHVARGGDYYWNNPWLSRCVNTADWQQNLRDEKQEWWIAYRNNSLDDFGRY